MEKVLISEKTIIQTSHKEVVVLGKKLEKAVRQYFRGSLAIRAIDTGSSNACEQELSALGNPFYDISRFGIHFVASPKHADMLLVTGPVSRNMVEPLKKAYEATPEPKIIVALGDDAIDGGLFKGSYAVMSGVDKVIPVHYQIPGDPPSPLVIISSLLKILNQLGSKK